MCYCCCAFFKFRSDRNRKTRCREGPSSVLPCLKSFWVIREVQIGGRKISLYDHKPKTLANRHDSTSRIVINSFNLDFSLQQLVSTLLLLSLSSKLCAITVSKRFVQWLFIVYNSFLQRSTASTKTRHHRL